MSDDYRTDNWILDLFPNFFDPCPYSGLTNDPKKDGLKMTWDYPQYDGVFVNPPYSNPLPWVKKAIEERENSYHLNQGSNRSWSAGTIVLLLKHDTSTEWYRLLHEAGAQFLLVNGRLKHQTGKSAAFPSILAVLT